MPTLEERISAIEDFILLSKKGEDLDSLPLTATGNHPLVFNPITKRVEKIPNKFESKLDKGTFNGNADDIIDLIDRVDNPSSEINLQGVTKNGNQTNIPIELIDDNAYLSVENTARNKGVKVFQDLLNFFSNTFVFTLQFPNLTGNAQQNFQDKSGTVALLEDLEDNLGKAPDNEFKFLQKGVGNIDLENNEIGDIFCGWSNDGTTRISEAIWNGGSLLNSDNFTPLVLTKRNEANTGDQDLSAYALTDYVNSQIAAIQTILNSDNINLDTVQEIVDAIEQMQTSIESFLVNDLTTGGTTKALTAEQGKILKGFIDTNDSNVVHKTGNESFEGIKSSTNTGSSQTNAIKLTNNGTGFLNSSFEVDNTNSGNGVHVKNTSSSGLGIRLRNTSSGFGFFSQNEGSGIAMMIDGVVGSTGFLFVIRDNGTNTLTIDKEGVVTGKSFIKSGGTASQFLKADGSVDSSTYLSAISTDAETQITATITEDKKVVSRLKLFNWWAWAKTQAITFGNKITFAAGTATSPPLIIPSGTLTTSPQNGAIERDSNGVLWETHNGVRKKITPTIPSTLLCINKYSNSTIKSWNLELTHNTTTFYTVMASGAQNAIKAFFGVDYLSRSSGYFMQKDSEYEYLLNNSPNLKVGFLVKQGGNLNIIDLTTFFGTTTTPLASNTTYKKYANSFKIQWSTNAGTIQFTIYKETTNESLSIYPDTLSDLNFIAYTNDETIKTVASSNIVLSSIYYSQEKFQDNFIIS